MVGGGVAYPPISVADGRPSIGNGGRSSSMVCIGDLHVPGLSLSIWEVCCLWPAVAKKIRKSKNWYFGLLEAVFLLVVIGDCCRPAFLSSPP